MARESDTNIGLAKKRTRDTLRKLFYNGEITEGEFKVALWALNEQTRQFKNIEEVEAYVNALISEMSEEANFFVAVDEVSEFFKRLSA